MKEISKESDMSSVLVHTGQHYDWEMSGTFLREFGLGAPDYNCEVGSGSHGIQTGRMLEKLDPILLSEKPDVVLVPGDTNTTLAGTLASYKLHIPTGHIESGMREYIWRPEEMNKIVADHCSDFLFCPIKRASENLRQENIPESRIYFTGDITYDMFLQSIERAKKSPDILNTLNLGGDFFLLTMHRAETVDHPDEVSGIVEALIEIDSMIVYPIHPRTKKNLLLFGLYSRLVRAKHIKLIDPVGYFEFINLLLNSKMVLTDSSGVLKEAFYALKPCVTLDYTTEYREIFDLGYNILAGRKKDRILESVEEMRRRVFVPVIDSPFGDGTASKQIVSILKEKDPKYPVM
jgi:UDP-N-acetylglucosamine 2-epimerase (non-hydrolysing)